MEINTDIKKTVPDIEQYIISVLLYNIEFSKWNKETVKFVYDLLPRNLHSTIYHIYQYINKACCYNNDSKINPQLRFTNFDSSNPTMFVLMGLPGSGKSTFRKNMELNGQYNIISRDDFIVEKYQHLIMGHENYNELYTKCWELSINDDNCNDDFVTHYKHILSKKQDVIIDMTNLSINSRKKWSSYAETYGYNLSIIWINRSVNQCIESQQQRNKQISAKTIIDMHQQLTPPILFHECNDVFIINHVDFFSK
ncbi:MAG: ATP-binding protein [Candidatus Riesia sp.]|nr:ATP-binding protein [Candidatus Riesia sp.]